MSELFLRDLVPIVELQAMELKRLLRDKELLSRKVDSLIEEIGGLRQTQQQDLALREKDQALRAQMQDVVNDLLKDRGVAPVDNRMNGRPEAVGKPTRVPPREGGRAKTTLVKAGGAVSEELFPVTGTMGIPSFLTAGDATGTRDPDPPIRKLFTRIRARGETG